MRIERGSHHMQIWRALSPFGAFCRGFNLMRSADDASKRRTADRTMRVFPQWLVMWDSYTRQLWAFPCFGAPPGTILHATDVNQLAGMIHRTQRVLADRPQ